MATRIRLIWAISIALTPAAIERGRKMTRDRVNPQPLLLGKRRGFVPTDHAKTDRDPINHNGSKENGIEVCAGKEGIREVLPGVQLERLLGFQTTHDGRLAILEVRDKIAGLAAIAEQEPALQAAFRRIGKSQQRTFGTDTPMDGLQPREQNPVEIQATMDNSDQFRQVLANQDRWILDHFRVRQGAAGSVHEAGGHLGRVDLAPFRNAHHHANVFRAEPKKPVDVGIGFTGLGDELSQLELGVMKDCLQFPFGGGQRRHATGLVAKHHVRNVAGLPEHRAEGVVAPLAANVARHTRWQPPELRDLIRQAVITRSEHFPAGLVQRQLLISAEGDLGIGLIFVLL